MTNFEALGVGFAVGAAILISVLVDIIRGHRDAQRSDALAQRNREEIEDAFSRFEDALGVVAAKHGLRRVNPAALGVNIEPLRRRETRALRSAYRAMGAEVTINVTVDGVNYQGRAVLAPKEKRNG
jgi:hypothetical protein